MRITVAQLPQEESSLESAWEHLAEHVEVRESQAVLLPEMPFHPWLAGTQSVDAKAWEAAAAAHEAWTSRIADLGVPAAFSKPVVERGKRLNRGCVAGDGVVAAVHDKYYLPDEPGFWEATWYERGDGSFDLFDLGPARTGMLLCTEMWFMDRARRYGADGAQLLVVPRATPRLTLDKWIAGGRTAAVVSGAFCLSANPWEDPGSDADLAGGGWIIDPDGVVLGITDESQPFLTLDLDLGLADAAKSTYPRYVAD